MDELTKEQNDNLVRALGASGLLRELVAHRAELTEGQVRCVGLACGQVQALVDDMVLTAFPVGEAE